MKMQIINCTAVISPNATDENIIVHQLKPFKQSNYPENKQIDGMNYIFANNNVFSMTSRICRGGVETQKNNSQQVIFAK